MRKQLQDTRDLLIDEIKTIGYPIETLPSESGYFVMADVSKMRDIIPSSYLEQHEYESDPSTIIKKNSVYMADGSIPLDLAVCRWLAYEKKVVAMPNSYFYMPGSPY